MTHKVNSVVVMDSGDIERYRQEGRVHAYGNLITTLRALRADGHNMDMGMIIAAIQLIKDEEMS